MLVICPLSEGIDSLIGEEFDSDSTYQNSRIGWFECGSTHCRFTFG